MEREIEYASNWWSTQIASDGLSPYQLSGFIQSLKKNLQAKYTGHWYANCPTRGQAFRAIESDASKGPSAIDNCLLHAAKAVGISDLAKRLPLYAIKMWVDPGEVEVSNSSSNCVIYRSNQALSDSPVRGTNTPSVSLDMSYFYDFADQASASYENVFQYPVSTSPTFDYPTSPDSFDDYDHQAFCSNEVRGINDYPGPFYQSAYYHREVSRV